MLCGDMNEEKLIETVLMFSCLWEESSMALKDNTFQFINKCGQFGFKVHQFF